MSLCTYSQLFIGYFVPENKTTSFFFSRTDSWISSLLSPFPKDPDVRRPKHWIVLRLRSHVHPRAGGGEAAFLTPTAYHMSGFSHGKVVLCHVDKKIVNWHFLLDLFRTTEPSLVVLLLFLLHCLFVKLFCVLFFIVFPFNSFSNSLFPFCLVNHNCFSRDTGIRDVEWEV